MPVYPGDCEVEVINQGIHAQTGYFNNRICMGIHSGTHVDAPIHKLEGAKSIDIIPLDRFIGKALVINVTEAVTKEEIPQDTNKTGDDSKSGTLKVTKEEIPQDMNKTGDESKSGTFNVTKEEIPQDMNKTGDDSKSGTLKVTTKEISLDMIKRYEDEIKECDMVLIRTDWSDFFGSERFFTEYPGFTEDAANWLASKAIKLIGLEMPSVHLENHALIHEIFLKKDIILVESLSNLKEIHKQYVTFYAIPLKLEGLEGSPVRAFAIED